MASGIVGSVASRVEVGHRTARARALEMPASIPCPQTRTRTRTRQHRHGLGTASAKRNPLSPTHQVTLSLTVAGRIVSELSKHTDGGSILKAAVAASVVLSALSSGASRGGGGRGSEPMYSITMGSAVRTLRRVCVIVVAQLVVSQIGGMVEAPASTTTGHRYYSYHSGGGGASVLLEGSIPASAWPAAESFVVTSLAVVLVGIAAGIASGSGGSSPEMERIRSSIQYTYADASAALFTEPRVRWVLAVSGAVFMSPISRLSDPRQGQGLAAGKGSHGASVRDLVAGLAMTWVNIAVGFISAPTAALGPSAAAAGLGGVYGYTGIELATALSMAVLLQALHAATPGLEVVQGYVEWHIASVLISLLRYQSVLPQGVGVGGAFNAAGVVVVAAGVLGRFLASIVGPLALHWIDGAGGNVAPSRQGPSPPHPHSTCIPQIVTHPPHERRTIANVGTLVVVNGAAQWLMDAVTSTSTQAVDSFASVAIAVVFCRGVIRVYNDACTRSSGCGEAISQRKKKGGSDDVPQ